MSEIKCGGCYERLKTPPRQTNEQALAEAKPAVLIYLGKGYCLDHYEKANPA